MRILTKALLDATIERFDPAMRPLVIAFMTLLAAGLALSQSFEFLHTGPYCSNSDYGQGVTCIGGSGAGGDDAYLTSRTVNYSPTGGNSVIVSAYTCADKACQQMPDTTLSIGDNINDPEPCMTKSPSSPFSLSEKSQGKEQLQEYIWVCTNIPDGVTSFTATCSVPNQCSFITLTVTEWTGLAQSDVFDTDGGAASLVRERQAALSTSSPTRYTNELLYTFLDNTRDQQMSPIPPYSTALQFFRGNINTASLVAKPGSQTTYTRWSTNDDWYGAIVALRTAASKPAKPELQ